MLRAYKYRIYPTDEQKVMLAKTFGCCRYVYNWALAKREEVWKEEGRRIMKAEMRRLIVSELKHKSAKWLNEVSDSATAFALDNLYEAYDRYFSRKANMPRFHKKESRQSFRDRRKKNRKNIHVDFNTSTLTIPKIKDIPCVFHRKFDGEIRQVHIQRTASGKYYASLLIESGVPIPETLPINPDTTIGIDTGVHNYATLSDGTVFDTPPINTKENYRLKKLQRKLKKKTKGSHKFAALKRRIAALYEKDKNRRHDYIHKITHYLAYENQATTYCVEDLEIKDMTVNKRISKQIKMNYFQGFYSQLFYKCAWNGKRVIKIDRFEPSSKRCSNCGYINKEVRWGQYRWICPVCGVEHDRDVNAAKNIKAIGLS